jgi:nucleoid DNA-binding protein
MEMINYIKELLKTHDCVIIPGLGGLIGHYEPARRNMSSGTMAPPMKRIAFNRVLRQNDGLLINNVADREGVVYDEARKLVEAFVDSVDQALQVNGSFLFTGIGKLTFDENRKLQFYPVLRENLLLETYSLPLVVAQPVNRTAEITAELTAASQQLRPEGGRIEGEGATPVYRSWIFKAAAVIGMAFLMTTAATSIVDGNISGDQLSLLPARAIHEGKTAPASDVVAFPSVDFQLYESDVQPSAKPDRELHSEQTIDQSVYSDKYFVIVGSFLDQARLEREMAVMKAKGYIVETMPGPKGYTRVCLVFDGMTVSRSSALDSIRSSVNAEAWLINS